MLVHIISSTSASTVISLHATGFGQASITLLSTASFGGNQDALMEVSKDEYQFLAALRIDVATWGMK